MNPQSAQGPRPPIIDEKYPMMVIAGLVVFATVMVFLVRYGDIGRQTPISQEVVETLTLRFSDGDDGAIVVRDAATGEETFRYAPGEGGFARTALRAMAFRREIEGQGSREPMMLHRTDKGRFILVDPVTEQSIGVNAFGKDNAAQFAVLFDMEEYRP